MKMKKAVVAVILALALCSAGVYAESMMKYEIADLDISLELPAEYSFVFTRDMDDDDSAYADLGLTKESLFENDSLFLAAMTEDQNSEVIVSMVASDWSQLYYDFNEMENSDLLEMAQVYLMDTESASDTEISDAEIFEGNSQAKFIKTNGAFTDGNKDGYVVQYVTVLNGNAYTVTFNSCSGEIGDEDAAVMEDVVSSISFHTVEAKDTGNSDAVYIVIIAVMALIIVVLIFVIHKKHYTIISIRNAGMHQPSSLAENETKAETETEANETPSVAEETKETEQN